MAFEGARLGCMAASRESHVSPSREHCHSYGALVPSARAILRAIAETFPCVTTKPLLTPIPREALRRGNSQEGGKGGRG